MIIKQIKQTMLDKGIPAEVMEQFVFPASEEETPEEKIAFASQMDQLLSREQILSVMQEQGCNKHEHSAESLLKFKGKTLAERIELLNSMSKPHELYSRLNGDGTLSVSWGYEDNGKYRCVCPIMEKLSKTATVSITFCGCCSGHIKYHFEQDLGVALRLVETVSSPLSSNGEKYCEHRYEILGGIA